MEFGTPIIPGWIRHLNHPLYRNIFSFGLGNRNLWGTETLLGDWRGEFLLIAKDFYPSSYITDLIASGERNPYRHKDEIPTNNNLIKTLSHFRRLNGATKNTECNFLYISACFLLRDDGVVRGKLPDEARVLRLSAPVVKYTIDHMPRLRCVVTMGKDAANALASSGLDAYLRSRELTCFSVNHPSYAMSDVERFRQWEPILDPPRPSLLSRLGLRRI